MNYPEIVSKLLALGLSPLPVAPYQNPNDTAHPFHKYLHQSKKVTDPWDNSVTYEPILEADGTFKAKFTGKNPSFLKPNGFLKTIEHKHYQNKLPTQAELLEWFANNLNGIGSLGSDRYRWLDLDRKHFANQGDCDLALLGIHCDAPTGWLERTQSGGYRLLVDCGESGADFTNFALTEGGDHVGELLGAGRFAVMAPTIGVNGIYENLNYGDPILLSELNIFPATIKKAIAITSAIPTILSENFQETFRTIQDNSGSSQAVLRQFSQIPLEIVISKAHRNSLRGVFEGSRDNEGAALIRDLIGAYTWLLSSGYAVDGDPYALLKEYCSRCLPPLDDGDCERIYKSGLKDNPSPCLSEDKLQNCVDAYLRPKVQDLRYKAPVKVDDLNDINLLDLLPKKYIEAISFGTDKPSAILPIIKGLAVATEQYLISKKIKYRNNPQEIFNLFCQNQEPPLQAALDSIPSDTEEIDIPAIKKTLAAYDLSQRKIKERIEKEALRAAREVAKAALKAEEKCELAKNIAAIKRFYSDRFKLNLLTKEVELDGAIFDIDTSRIYFGEEINITISKNDAIDVIAVIAESNKYHPVYDYLEDCHKLLGDDTSILNGLAAKCFGVDNPLYEAFLKKTLIAAVARVFYPMTKFEKLIPKVAKVDHVFCLVSSQGAKKSTFFEALTSEAFFTDNLDKDLAHKDNIMRLHRKWICEIGEIDRVTNSRYEGDLKNFITIKTDIQRFAYLRAQKVCPRQFLFVGTSNRDDFLTDSTGDRRYWIVRTNKKINSKFAEENRDAIWAAAVSLYKNGAEWWLSDVEQEASNHNNRNYQNDSPWMPTITDYCVGREKVSTTEILYRIEPQKAKHTQLMQREVANCLIRIGYAKNGSRHKVLIDGASLQVYSWVLSECNLERHSPSNACPEPLGEDDAKSRDFRGAIPVTPYPVSNTAITELLSPYNIENTHSVNTHIQNDDQNTCITNSTKASSPILDSTVTLDGCDGDISTSQEKLESASPKKHSNLSDLRPVTADDLGSANPVTIINIVDNTSGVLISLGRDGVRYGDYLAKPQNVRVQDHA